jgi:hypothetical protein
MAIARLQQLEDEALDGADRVGYSVGGAPMTPMQRAECATAVNMRRARAILHRYEVRCLKTDGETVIGVWSDRDSLAVRSGLDVVGWGDLPIRYLDSSDVPDSHKGSYLDGEPVPMEVLHAMEANPLEPWRIRDRMMGKRAMGTCSSVEEPVMAPAPPAIDGRALGRGWAIWQHWHRWDPRAANEHRSSYCGDEQRWLLDLGSTENAHRLKLLLDRLEMELERGRETIVCRSDRATVNQHFVETFRAELQHMRGHFCCGRDALSISHAALQRFLPVLQRLAHEIDGSSVLGLFG